MKRFVFLVVSTIMLFTACSSKTAENPKNSEPEVVAVTTKTKSDSELQNLKFNVNKSYFPLNFNEVKAVWFSYIDLADMLTGKSETQFEINISKAFEKVKSLGCNTVYVHVRPFGDAFYNSGVYPQTRYCDYDALEIMVKSAHSYGLSIHAWVNPLRCEKEKYIKNYSDEFLIKKWYSDKAYFGKYLVQVENSEQLWLNPTYDEVRTMICNGVSEIVRNYNVDGIHIDDYFYPTTEETFDAHAFSASKSVSVSDFRIENINLLVSQMYQTVKSENEKVQFGISPQGNIQNNYSELFADVKKWASERGYCDYIVPQIYYGFENPHQPFEKVLQDWNDMTCKDVKLIVGLAYYKIHEKGEFSENTGIISRQLEKVLNSENSDGVALYNYKNIFEIKNENSDVELALLRGKLQ
ncbi:MAG: hypothetical protein E7509_00815 [Ruminococcus sp.]|nr:hypothetical protein [Ruminococcus sp.]